MPEVSARAKGDFLEDTVGDIFIGYGFDIQKRIRLKDKFDVEHEIDVLATKKEVYGTITTAVECKYHKEQIGIEDVRNFHSKLMSLGLTKGILVSAGGFTSDAEAQAKVLGVELWDLAALQDRLGKVQQPNLNRIDNALPINGSVNKFIFPLHIRNSDKMILKGDIDLDFYPYYLVSYQCFSQDRVGGSIVNLESRGIVAVSAVKGDIHDCVVTAGTSPALPISGWSADCTKVEPRTVYPSEFENLGIKLIHRVNLTPAAIRETEAKTTVQRELAKNLTEIFYYRVGNRRREKLVRPKKIDIEVVGARLAYIPFLTIYLASQETSYTRLLQAATLRYSKDDTVLCRICSLNPSIAVCESCGSTTCVDDLRNCLSCGRNLCSKHAVSKGLLFKKYYCAEHILNA